MRSRGKRLIVAVLVATTAFAGTISLAAMPADGTAANDAANAIAASLPHANDLVRLVDERLEGRVVRNDGDRLSRHGLAVLGGAAVVAGLAYGIALVWVATRGAQRSITRHCGRAPPKLAVLLVH